MVQIHSPRPLTRDFWFFVYCTVDFLDWAARVAPLLAQNAFEYPCGRRRVAVRRVAANADEEARAGSSPTGRRSTNDRIAPSALHWR
jgi:hypothetical protein